MAEITCRNRRLSAAARDSVVKCLRVLIIREMATRHGDLTFGVWRAARKYACNNNAVMAVIAR